MEIGRVTVVVPIYKTEKYLDKCISSIANQTYSNLEILLIDDGSPDNCPQICDAWAKKDQRIRVIHKQNEGLGLARNTGIDNASGEYICFFDSDDFVAPDTIEKSFCKLESTQAEVAVFGFSAVDISEKILSTFAPDASKELYRNDEVRDEFLPDLIAPDPKGDIQRRFYMSACMMMFSRKLIDRCKWRFVSERVIISEDVYSLLELFGYVNSVVILPEALYYYRANQLSTSRKYQPDRYQKIKHFYCESVLLCERHGYSERIIQRMADPYLAFTRAAMKQEAKADLPLASRIKSIKAIVTDEVLQEVLRIQKKDTATLPRRIIFWAMKHHLSNLCFLLLSARNALA